AGLIVVSVKVEGKARLCQVWIKETNASEPLLTCRNSLVDVETEAIFADSGQSSEATCLLSERHPARRWRELNLGSYVERENLSL
ncbi:unnamed protein product, partial [marine sediment metagenome]